MWSDRVTVWVSVAPATSTFTELDVPLVLVTLTGKFPIATMSAASTVIVR